MKLSNYKYYIKLDDKYFTGKGDKSDIKGLGTGALTGTNSIPMFGDKDKAKSINDVMTLRTRVTEIIDAIRYQEIYDNEVIEKLTIEFVED